MSAAVKLALGETQLVAETRSFLENNGVYLDAFNAVSSLHAAFHIYGTKLLMFFNHLYITGVKKKIKNVYTNKEFTCQH